MYRTNSCALCVLFCIVISSQALSWQDANIEKGLSQITEGRVTAGISFLASDELAGRATGSPEFNVAAAYVASRFRGAGLEGGATDGSFYHETKQTMSQVPNGPTKLVDGDGKAIENFGLLAAGQEPLTYKGAVKKPDLTKELDANDVSGFVVSGRLESDAKGQRLMGQIARMTSSMAKAGAKALLLVVEKDSELVGLAKATREKPRLVNSRGKFEIPVVLVPEVAFSVGSVDVEIQATIINEAVMRNVIGLIRGSDPELGSEAVLFSAHLDHLGSQPSDSDGIFNGADDDATGVTAVVTLADAFGAMPKPKRTLIFMTFWGEESGLLGSKQFVLTPSWPLEKIVANVNIEMIGRPEPGSGGKIWMTGWNESNLGSLMNEASRPFGVEIFNHPKFSAMLYRSSDNWSFANAGVIAHSFSAGSLHPDYHGPDDEWDRLELPHMTRVIQGLFVGSLPLANGVVKPAKPEK